MSPLHIYILQIIKDGYLMDTTMIPPSAMIHDSTNNQVTTNKIDALYQNKSDNKLSKSDMILSKMNSLLL